VDVTENLVVGGRPVTLVHPPDATALIDEEAFEHEEFLPYWAELWPSAVALSAAVAARRPRGCRVVELGCGLALPAIVAALEGAHVLATDWSTEALAYARRNAHANGAQLETLRVAWADAAALLARAPFDLVVAADVLYERRNVPQLLELLPRLGAEVLLADPGRPALTAFLEGAADAWLVTRDEVPELPRGGVYRLARRVR
jgi:predicted nicotinamide N-methyase